MLEKRWTKSGENSLSFVIGRRRVAVAQATSQFSVAEVTYNLSPVTSSHRKQIHDSGLGIIRT